MSNLEQCAPAMSPDERLALARYTVDTIRSVLRDGMLAAPRVLFVGAAGNASSSLSAANPATRFTLPNFVLVGAVDSTGAPASFTNVGVEVTLYANGVRVPARLPGGMLSYPSGTSEAAPLVTNAAAKVLAVNPALSGAALRGVLEETAVVDSAGRRLCTRLARSSGRARFDPDARVARSPQGRTARGRSHPTPDQFSVRSV